MPNLNFKEFCLQNQYESFQHKNKAINHSVKKTALTLNQEEF